MDKLISLQSVITMLENKRFEVEKDLSKAYLLADVQEQIEHLPAAFDKEKVIEELKNTTGDIHFTEDGSFNGKIIEDFNFIQAKTAISIVEKGGIE